MGRRRGTETGAPGTALWIASAETESGFLAQGFGRTPPEALEAMLATWRDGYAPMADADPQYFHDMRDDVSIRRVAVGKGYVLGRTDSLWSEEIMGGDDGSLSEVWDRYVQDGARPPRR